jgi:hypothetical protein
MHTSIGPIQVRRHWWGPRCLCAPGGYLVDSVLGIEGSLSRRLQEQTCRLAADVSFAKTGAYLAALCGVDLAAETIRVHCERKAAGMARWQATEADSAATFKTAAGDWEFAVDAAKVNTRERGWRDLKIAVVQKRPAGPAATPDQWQARELPPATARVMWADIATSDRFRRSWHPRLRRLGLAATANLHVLGDGASWIWRSTQRALTGCRQTLDIYHACAHIAQAGKELHGEGTAAATAFLEQGRSLLLSQGWSGVCRLVGEHFERDNSPRSRAVLEGMMGYFVAHISRLDYRQRLATGQAIGSGVVEGAAKTLGLRLKARGARWKHKNARAMAALVCLSQSHQWADFWQHAA